MAIPKKSKVATLVDIGRRGKPQISLGTMERFQKALDIRNKREEDDADIDFLLDHIIETYTIEVLESENTKAEKAPVSGAKQVKPDKPEKPELHAVQQSA